MMLYEQTGGDDRKSEVGNGLYFDIEGKGPYFAGWIFLMHLFPSDI